MTSESPIKHRFFARVARSVREVVSFFTEHPVVVPPLTLSVSISEHLPRGRAMESSLSVVLRFNEETFCDVLYVLHPTKGVPQVSIQYITSDIGQGTGTFLLYLQLWVAYRMGIQDVVLENETDDPVRAARGIYEAFEVEERGKNRTALRGQSLAEKLHTVEGAMRLRMGPWFEAHAVRKLEGLMDQVEDKGVYTVWSEEAPASVARWLREEKQRGFRGGMRKGGRRKTHHRRRRVSMTLRKRSSARSSSKR